MGYKVVGTPTLHETVFGDNHATVRPMWTMTRELASPDPMNHGRKPNTWPDGGTAYAWGAAELEMAWNATVDNFPPYTNWGYLASSFGQPAWAQGFLLGVSTEIFQDQSEIDLGARYGSDVALNIRFWSFDLHLQDVPAESKYIELSQEMRSGYPNPTAEELGLVVAYKTRSEAAVLADLVPYQIGDTFISFEYAVNPKTQASLANVWLRWRLGTNTDTTSYDGQQQIMANGVSKQDVRFNTTLNNLVPDQYYTFWLHIERNTSGLTSADGNPKTWKTKPAGQVTFPPENAVITVSPSPTQCKFEWTVPMVVTRLGYLPIPASQVEVMLQTDFDTYGWDPTRTIYSRLQPAQVPDVTRADSNPTIDPGLIFNSNVLVAFAQQYVRGNGPVSPLTAHREYVFRLRVDFRGGATYPISGTFSTPDYSVARPETSNQYTEGVL